MQWLTELPADRILNRQKTQVAAIDGDRDQARLAGLLQQPVHPGACQPHARRRLLLVQAADIIEPGGAGHQLALGHLAHAPRLAERLE